MSGRQTTVEINPNMVRWFECEVPAIHRAEQLETGFHAYAQDYNSGADGPTTPIPPATLHCGHHCVVNEKPLTPKTREYMDSLLD
jgi:hypothetical protein